MRAETAIKLLRNEDCMWEKLKGRYNLTDYQIALLRYLLFTFLSESSKLFFILFPDFLNLTPFILIPQTPGTVHCNTFISLLYPAHSWRISLQYICRLSAGKYRFCSLMPDTSAAGFFNENSTDFIVHGLHFNKLCACTCFFIKKTSAFCCEKETI